MFFHAQFSATQVSAMLGILFLLFQTVQAAQTSLAEAFSNCSLATVDLSPTFAVNECNLPLSHLGGSGFSCYPRPDYPVNLLAHYGNFPVLNNSNQEIYQFSNYFYQSNPSSVFQNPLHFDPLFYNPMGFVTVNRQSPQSTVFSSIPFCNTTEYILFWDKRIDYIWGSAEHKLPLVSAIDVETEQSVGFSVFFNNETVGTSGQPFAARSKVNMTKINPLFKYLRLRYTNMTGTAVFLQLLHPDGTVVYQTRTFTLQRQGIPTVDGFPPFMSNSAPRNYFFKIFEIKDYRQPWTSAINSTKIINSTGEWINMVKSLEATSFCENNLPFKYCLLEPFFIFYDHTFSTVDANSTISNGTISIKANVPYLFSDNLDYFNLATSHTTLNLTSVLSQLSYNNQDSYSFPVQTTVGMTLFSKINITSSLISGTPCFTASTMHNLISEDSNLFVLPTLINQIRIRPQHTVTETYSQFFDFGPNVICKKYLYKEISFNITLNQTAFNVSANGALITWLRPVISNPHTYVFKIQTFTGTATFFSPNAIESECRIVHCSGLSVYSLDTVSYQLSTDSTFRVIIYDRDTNVELFRKIYPLVTSKSEGTAVTFEGNAPLTWILIIGIFSSVLFLPCMFCIFCFLCFPKFVKKLLCLPFVLFNYVLHHPNDQQAPNFRPRLSFSRNQHFQAATGGHQVAAYQLENNTGNPLFVVSDPDDPANKQV